MTVFGAYSKYYNLLYKDKDYTGEARYIHELIRKHAPGARSVLDLGCGTGRHDFELAKLGYDITGVDMSDEMLAAAKSRLSTFNSPLSTELHSSGSCSFLPGDIRTVRLDQTFDVVVSLFHVMSYQVTNEDLRAAFDTARAHLNPGGFFIFDFWYGPAVLSDPPAVRIKRLGDDEIELVRIAEPEMHYNENTVGVNYQVMIIEKSTGRIEQVCESHRMRYLFLPEINGLLIDNSFAPVDAHEWLTGELPGNDSWNVCVVGAANG